MRIVIGVQFSGSLVNKNTVQTCCRPTGRFVGNDKQKACKARSRTQEKSLEKNPSETLNSKPEIRKPKP